MANDDQQRQALTSRTLVPIGAIAVAIGMVAGGTSWAVSQINGLRDPIVNEMISIQRKVDGLSHRIDMFDATFVNATRDTFTRSDMRLWVWKARAKYPDLPDTE